MPEYILYNDLQRLFDIKLMTIRIRLFNKKLGEKWELNPYCTYLPTESRENFTTKQNEFRGSRPKNSQYQKISPLYFILDVFQRVQPCHTPTSLAKYEQKLGRHNTSRRKDNSFSVIIQPPMFVGKGRRKSAIVFLYTIVRNVCKYK